MTFFNPLPARWGGGICLWMLIILSGCVAAPEQLPITRPLTAEWQFRRVGEDRWYPARVPGCVHTDLLANDLIPDPFHRDNESRLQWISNPAPSPDHKTDWEYHGRFTVPETLLAHDHVEMSFGGLDTAATVFLNEVKILETDNMFRTWEADVKSRLKPGQNVLRIHFTAPMTAAAASWRKLGYELPGGPQVMIRKAPYHFGWDWGPRFITSGIWRPVSWKAWNDLRLTDVFFRTLSITSSRAEMEAVFSLQTDRPCLVDFIVESPDVLTEKGTGELIRIQKEVRQGHHSVPVLFSIPNPRIWQPNGLGKPFLTNLAARAAVKGKTLDSLTRRVGVRTVELVTTPDARGESFFFRVNGRPVYMKGANYIPQDSFPSRVSGERRKKLIQQAREAGMNMLRVWGGGIYEEDEFYDLCDENGLLVWQDFMFACAMYPGGTEFRETVRQEAMDNIRRLRGHACLALWCGNNEISEGWERWGWQTPFSTEQRQAVSAAYQSLFHELLPGLVRELAPGQAYWPSSPKFGRGDVRSLTEGDLHYWGVWHDGEPFEVLLKKTGRFMSEFGVQAFPAMDTIRQFTEPGDQRLNSPVLNVHQKHPRGQALIEMYIARDYKPAKDFEGFVHLSQMAQADGVRLGLEAQRRAMPFCMGSLFWQLNDCWPAVSWSAIDFYGRPKALYYHAKHAYSPLLLSAAAEDNQIRLYLVSDLAESAPGTLKIRLMGFDGAVYWQEGLIAVAEPGKSLACWSRGLNDAAFRVDKTASVLWAGFFKGERLLAQCRYYFVKPAQFKLKAPGIRFAIEPGRETGEMTVSLSCDYLAKNVLLHLPGAETSWSDNYFDLIPGIPTSVPLKTNVTTQTARETLHITSVINAMR